MNLGELKTALKRYGFDDDDPLTIWINAALNDLILTADWSFTRNSEKPYYPADTPELAIGVPALRIFSAYDLQNGEELEFMPFTEWESVIDLASTPPEPRGNPQYFTLSKTTGDHMWLIHLYPIPTEQTRLRIDYHGTVDELSDDADVPSIPSVLHYAIVVGAASIALKAENQEDRATTARNDFLDQIGRASNFFHSHQSQNLGVTDVMGYFDA